MVGSRAEGGRCIIKHNCPDKIVMEKEQAENFIREELSKNRSQEEIIAILCQELGAPPELVKKFVSKVADEGPVIGSNTTPTENPAPPLVQEIPEIERSKSSIPEDVLEAEILKALGKNRKQSDVVVLVCEKTGMNWAQAQRMVARVATKHHNKLSVRQNWLTLPLSITAIIVGGALVAAAVAEDYELFVGGIGGLVVGLKKQFS